MRRLLALCSILGLLGTILPTAALSAAVGTTPEQRTVAYASGRGTHHLTPDESSDSSGVIVAYSSQDESLALTSASSLGATRWKRARKGRFSVLTVPDGESASAFSKRLESMPGVRYSEPNYVVRKSETPADPNFSLQWGMTRLAAPAAWDITRGSGVVVAVVDTGVDLSHPEFVGQLDMSNDYDFVNGDSTAQDDEGHGTHVAGIIAAAMNNTNTGAAGVVGVANLATILPIKVLSSTGDGTMSNLADGIRYAADKGAKVINLSVGSDSYSQTVDEAVQYAIGKDVVVVAAAGNDGAYGVCYPARLNGVIGVGSTTSSDERSYFSNYGPGMDVCAPGTNIFSTLWDGTSTYGYASGTSMATPHAVGVVALIRAAHPDWTRPQVESQLTSTAFDLGMAGRDDFFGYGLVQAAAAVGLVGSPTGSLSGRISDSSGQPLSNVLVEVTGHPSVLSDANGSYALGNLQAGLYEATYSKGGYVTQTRSVVVAAAITTTEDVSLSLSSPPTLCTITALPGYHGTISPSGVTGVAEGDSLTYCVTPDFGYYISSVVIDGVATATAGSYLFANVSANHTIAATFAMRTCELNYTAGPGGLIVGAANQTVPYNGSGTLVTALSSEGYRFARWSDGVLSASRFESGVSADVSATAEFEQVAQRLRTVTYIAGQGGRIAGVTPQFVVQGGSGIPVTAVPDSGYRFVTWSDGVPNASRTETRVLESTSVTATFVKDLTPASMSTPVAPSTMYRGRSAVLYGYVAPVHSSGTYLVTLKFYKRNSSGSYVYHHSVSAKRFYYSSGKSKYKVYISLPRAGRWRVRAYHSCANHIGSYSGYDYIVVK